MVEELGFYTEVGLGAPRAEDKNKNANLEHSIGYRFQRIKGHFVTPSAHQPHFHTPCNGSHTFREPPSVGVASATLFDVAFRSVAQWASSTFPSTARA